MTGDFRRRISAALTILEKLPETRKRQKCENAGSAEDEGRAGRYTVRFDTLREELHNKGITYENH